jgi:hypothetical protein
MITFVPLREVALKLKRSKKNNYLKDMYSKPLLKSLKRNRI